MTVGGLDLDTWTIVLVVVGGFVAGWVDAVVGGGGLVQLPVLLLVPGAGHSPQNDQPAATAQVWSEFWADATS